MRLLCDIISLKFYSDWPDLSVYNFSIILINLLRIHIRHKIRIIPQPQYNVASITGQSRICKNIYDINRLRNIWTKPIKSAIYDEITIFNERLFHHAESIGQIIG
jgi:hypothetical protein